MKLSLKQKRDIESALFFAPSNCSYEEVTDEDIQRYLDYSDRGVGKLEVRNQVASEGHRIVRKGGKYSGLSKLMHGKQRRDLQVTMYLEDWYSTCNAADFVSEPQNVVEWLAAVMKKPAILEFWHLVNRKNN